MTGAGVSATTPHEDAGGDPGQAHNEDERETVRPQAETRTRQELAEDLDASENPGGAGTLS